MVILNSLLKKVLLIYKISILHIIIRLCYIKLVKNIKVINFIQNIGGQMLIIVQYKIHMIFKINKSLLDEMFFNIYFINQLYILVNHYSKILNLHIHLTYKDIYITFKQYIDKIHNGVHYQVQHIHNLDITTLKKIQQNTILFNLTINQEMKCI